MSDHSVPELTSPEIPPGHTGRRAPIVALLVVVAVFTTLAGVIAVDTPAWEAADEPGHVENIETGFGLARGVHHRDR